MKRVVTLVLAMLMVMSCLTAFSVLAEGGTPGTITVFLRDFEDGTLQASDAGKINSVLDDGTGNKYGAVSIDPDELASAPKSTSVDKRPGVELGYRLRVGKNIPYISGKKYALSWDLAKVSGSTVSALGAGTSGIEGMATANKILGWRSDKWNAINQYYLSLNAYTGENNTGDKAVQTQEDLSSGWRRYTGKPFNYLLTTSATDLTPAPDGTVGSIGNLFFEVGISDTLLKLLKDNKAYVGGGFEASAGVPLTGHTFTIESGDLYGDEEGLVANGGEFTAEQLCKEWSLGEDCSALKSAKRSAAFAKALEDANFGFGIDNVRISAETTYYNQTVNVEGDATVRAITNTGSGCEESNIVPSGSTFTANDYFGLTLEISTDGVPSVTYNDKDVKVVQDGDVFKATIAPSEIAGGANIKIGVKAGEKEVEIYGEDFQDFTPGALSGGWEIHDSVRYDGAVEADSTGNVYLVIKNFKPEALVDLYIAKGNVKDIYPRFRIKNPGYKFDIGRAYTVSYSYKYTQNGTSLTNVSPAQTFFNFTGGSVNEWDKNGWYSWVPNDTANYTQFYNSNAGSLGEDGWRSVAAPAFTAISAFTKRVDGEPLTEIGLSNNEFEFKGFNNGTDASSILYQLTKQAIDANTTDGTVNRDAAVTALGTLLKEKDLKICFDNLSVTTLAETKNVTVTVDDGATVSVNKKTATNGGSIAVPMNFESGIAITAKEGYVLNSVEIDGAVQEITENASSFETKYKFTDASTIKVSTKTAQMRTVTANVGVGGKLSVNGKVISDDGAATSVVNGSDVSITVTPDSGYKVDYLKIDGKIADISADGGTVVFAVTADALIEVAFREAGTEGTVIVYSEDFEDGAANVSGGTGIETEGDNHYYTLKNISGSDAATVAGADKRPGSEVWQYRFNISDKVEYINGKSYSFTWKYRGVNNGDYFSIVKGSSGFNAMSGGYLKTYNGSTPVKTSQWYGQHNTQEGSSTIKSVSAYDSATGWQTVGYSGISYGLWDGESDIPSATINGLFMQSNFYNAITKLLVENKAYMGEGLKNADSYKFTITDSDLYGDEEGLKENGGKFTRAELCKEWNFGMDCSPLKSAKREAAINKAFEDAGLELQMDDVEMKADAAFYNIPVKINGNAEVTFTTNTYTNETVKLTANGTVSANDYYGLKASIKLTGDANDSVKSITFGGEEINLEDPSVLEFTIPANKIAAKELVIDIETITDATPVVSNVKVTGNKEIGSTLTVSYDYSCKDADDSTIKWQVLNGEVWEDIEGATGKTYVTKASDNAKNIRAVVTAKSVAGNIWKNVPSTPFFVGELAFFVAPNGNDSTGDGSMGKPFATITPAKEKIKAMIAAQALPAGEVTVYFREGRYPITSAITFTASDSGNENTTIVYKAYNNEEVDFVGSQKISANKISKVTEDDKDKYGNKILDRIIDDQARANLYKIDLSEYKGVIPSIPEYGWNSNGSPIFTNSWRAMDLIVNNERLIDARWPNDEPDTAMINSERVVCADKTQPSKVGYPDPENRTALWNTQAVVDDGMVDLHVAYHWYSNIYKIGSIDATDKSFMTKYGTSYQTAGGLPLYFFNILEEIDMPGESFIDRERKIAYFYPTNPIDGTEDVELSTYTGSMISMNGASYITFDGINFRNSRERFINVNNGNHITFRDSVMAHGGSNAASLSGYNITVDKCHVYDTGYGGISIGGGDRKTLTQSNNVVSNSIFSDNARTKTSYSPAVAMNGVGVLVSHNIIYNNQHEAISFGGNDHVMEYNEIYNSVKEHGDMGAIYWGRDPSVLGIVIRNNYFHDNGNLYNGGWNQSIFGDDGNFGADIYNNIFYRATLTEDRGGSTSSYPIKTNGGQYYNVHNNIFVDNPCSNYFQSWVGTNFDSPTQGQYITYNYDCKPSGSAGNWTFNVNGSQWNKIKNYCENEAWIEHYKGTIWEPFFSNFSSEKAEKMFAFANAKDYDGMVKYVKTFAPSQSNTFDNNVNIKNLKNRPEGISRTGNEVVSNNYASSTDVVNGKSIFKDYGKDFSLTEEGLAEVRKSATGFENIDTSTIGVGYDDYCTGYAPKAADAKIIGNPAVGGILKASYSYSDPDGDPEGHSVFVWYEAESEKGPYTRILGKGDNEILLSELQAGKFVKYTMIPYDKDNRYGKMIESAPIQISAGSSAVDKSELSELLETADALIKSAVVGEGDGMYPAEALAKFKTEFNSAADVFANNNVYQYEVNNAVRALKNAIDAFKLAQISTLEYLNIKDMLADKDGWTYAQGGAAVFENGTLTIPAQTKVLYTDELYLNKIFTFRMRFELTDDSGVTKIPGDEAHILQAATYVRSNGYNGQIWANGNSGFLMWFHNDTYEAQEWKPEQTTPFYSADNTFFTEFGKDYEIAFGAVDTTEGVRLLIYVDGVLVYDETYGTALLGKVGALGFANHTQEASNINVVISPAVVDYEGLNTAIAGAEAFLKLAKIGSDYGQYPADKIEALNKAVSDGKEVAADELTTQIAVDRQTLVINQALAAAKESANSSADVTGDTIYKINYDIRNAEFVVSNNAKLTLQMENGKPLPRIKARVDTPKGPATMDVPEAAEFTGNELFSYFTPPHFLESPSGALPSNAITVEGVYSTGDEFITSDALVRFSFPGAKGKRIYYKDETGKYVEIKTKAEEDSAASAQAAIGEGLGAAKLNVGDDLVIWSNFITEFVIFQVSVNNSNEESQGPGGAIGGVAVNGGGAGTGSNGFFSGSTTSPNADNPFIDMVNHWAKAEVVAMNKAGIVSGVSDNLFEPDRNITRAEFAAIIARALKLPDKEASFKDVNGEWFAPYVGACADAGIITGFDGYFRPNDNITRQEMAVIIVNAYSYLGKAGANGGIEAFSDKADIAKWAKAAVDTASSVGLISGMGDGTFAPNANATRAQAASLIYRLVK